METIPVGLLLLEQPAYEVWDREWVALSTRERLPRALSDSIVKVAEDELARLSGGLDRGAVTEAVENALDELKGLQSGRIPDYEDEWVALFYMTWFQPAQINLAYSMINTMVNGRAPEKAAMTDKGGLHVVDFGCGALAMQFAVAFAAADALQMGERVASIRICSMDASQAMVDIGSKVWERFKIEVKGSTELAILNEACEALKPTRTVTFWHSVPTRGEDSWLSALHTFYATNVESVKDWLARIANRTKPDVGFITSHGSGRGHELIRTVSPFENGDFSDIVTAFDGELEGITRWRRNLDCPHDYLKRRVKWEWRPASTLIYTKR